MSINEALNILGLNSNFSEKELKRAYYALVKKYHPDQFEKSSKEAKEHAEAMMKKINLAYDTLVKQLKERNGKYSSYNNKKENQSQNKINNAGKDNNQREFLFQSV